MKNRIIILMTISFMFLTGCGADKGVYSIECSANKTRGNFTYENGTVIGRFYDVHNNFDEKVSITVDSVGLAIMQLESIGQKLENQYINGKKMICKMK